MKGNCIVRVPPRGPRLRLNKLLFLWLVLGLSPFCLSAQDGGPQDPGAQDPGSYGAAEPPQAAGPSPSLASGLYRSFVVVLSPAIETSWDTSILYNLFRLDRIREVYLWPERISPAAAELFAADLLEPVLRWAALHGMDFVLVLDRDMEHSSEGVVSTYQVYQTLSSSQILSGAFTADPPSEQELQQTFWLPLLSALEDLKAQRRTGQLSIRGVPGSKIRGFSKEPIQLDQAGEAVIPVDLPGTYRYKALAPGYQGTAGVLALLESPAQLSLKQAPLKPWVLELGSLMGQFGDVWVQHRNADNRLWLGFGLGQYWIGIYYPNQEDIWPYTQPFISLPLLEPGVQAGYLFFDDTAFFRPYVSLAALLRVNTALMRLDPAAFMVLAATAGLEYKIWPAMLPFIEVGFRFYPFCSGLFVAASRGGEVRAPATFLYSDSWYLDIPLFRLGVRFSL